MSHSNDGHSGLAHPCPLWILFATGLVLIFFTWVTVAVTVYDFGYQMNLIIAMAVAVIKASFVILFFMHLWWEKPLNTVFFIASILFVGIFIVMAMFDTMVYDPNMIPGYAPAINQ